MKKIFSSLLFIGLLAGACSKNETPESTQPADYAETYHDQIDNPEKDSVKKDSAAVPSAMPPQAPDEDGK